METVTLGVKFALDDSLPSDNYAELPLTFTMLPDAGKVFVDENAQRELETAMFPKLHSGRPVLILPTQTVTTMRDYSAANEGIDLESSENYPRMFYFSATTLTTLGFGDIVPMTARARLWVSIEAIAGVVLIGIFLNLLGSRDAPGSKESLTGNIADSK